ncbi:LacI family DNA-binding transcriptional regulator [Actinospica sp. MGRD01-02]|uniref:LacI family DNA-binding transcriptional regulator n=1 Tax=Actinospica acidithermotolerans TaxID=2828514 RepID=A0A941IGK4_9ACTN|nr:LacI family DNA-binding transcriptional regulator [Actinospica acidithermotolerans]MBR7826229.1 LacI family DNA-binding transcriptional regulator [Actinospica acidithermotolerans]
MDASQYPTGAPTLEHVARVAGVSRATVSRVINNTRNVDPQIAEVVRAAVEATGYVPNQAARSLVTRRTNSVALVVSEGEDRTVPVDDAFVGRVFTDPYFGRVVSGLFSVLRPHGVNLVLMFVETDEMRRQLLGYLRQGHVDGVLLISSHAQDPLPKMLTEAGLPAVLSERPTTPLQISYVDAPQRVGARLAAEHLAARGCRKVATIAGPMDMSAGRDRLAGFREAMAEHGYPDIPSAAGYFTQESGSAAMEHLLDEHPDLDGVFAANDLMALGAVTVLHERGRRIPEDVAVIGFDDHHAAMLCRPALTTVHLPVEDMAAQMARLLLDRLDRPELPVAATVFEPTLVVRASA